MRQYYLRSPLLNDSRVLRDPQYSQFPSTIAANRRLLHALAEDPAQKLLVFEASEDEAEEKQKTVLGFLRVLRASEGGRYEVHCYPDVNFSKDKRASAEFKQALFSWLEDHHEILQLGFLLPLADNERDEGGIGPAVTDGIARGADTVRAERIIASVLDDLGFVAETQPVEPSELLRAASSLNADSVEGAVSYRRWFWDRGVQGHYSLAFVPAETGIVLITLDPEAVRAVSFLNYEEKPADPWVMNEAWRAGLTDRKGMTIKKDELSANAFSASDYLSGLGDLAKNAVRQVQEYIDHERQEFTLPFATDAGTQFQRLVWRIIRNIPYGSTRTYEEVGQAVIAESVRTREAMLSRAEMQLRGKELARAVGGACRANPLQLIIPCHRVIGKDGHILGYTGDPRHKSWLLWEEQIGLSNGPQINN